MQFQSGWYLIGLLTVHVTDDKRGCGFPAAAHCRDTLVRWGIRPEGWGAGVPISDCPPGSHTRCGRSLWKKT